MRPVRGGEERVGERAAGSIEGRGRQEGGAVERERDLAELEGRVAQAIEARAQGGLVERGAVGAGEGGVHLDLGRGAALGHGGEAGALAEAAFQAHVDRDAVGGALQVLQDRSLGRGVARAEHAAAGDLGGQAAVGAEPDLDLAAGGGAGRLAAVEREVPDAAADLALAGEPALDEQALAARERPRRAHDDELAAAPAHDAQRLAHLEAPVIAAPAVDEPPVIHAAQEARARAAREHLQCGLARGLERRGGGRRRDRRVDRGAVEADRRAHVLGALEPALDLHRGHAERDQIGDRGGRLEVLRGQEVGRVAEVAERAVDHEAVREAARLGAGAAVRAAAADRLAREALARVGDAERAVHEDLQLHGGRAADRGDLVDRELAGEDHARRAELLRELDGRGVGARHLRGRVDRQPGGERAGEAGEAEVLHDDRVGGGLGAGVDRGLDERQLVVEDQGVQGDVAAHPVVVQRAQRGAERGGVEVPRAGAGVQALQAEVDGVGARADGRGEGGLVAGGREDLGAVGARHAGVLPGPRPEAKRSAGAVSRGTSPARRGATGPAACGGPPPRSGGRARARPRASSRSPAG